MQNLRCVECFAEETLPPEDLPIIAALREQIDHDDPVQVGWSGQIKAYREEKCCGGAEAEAYLGESHALFKAICLIQGTTAFIKFQRERKTFVTQSQGNNDE